MPRTLPWLAGAAIDKAGKQSSSSSPFTSRGKRAVSPVDFDLNASGAASPFQQRQEERRQIRTPSTSPPPAPPPVEYMREGYHADDIYMMVEDELVSTAKMFTQHIHHAEYVRLKKLALSRGKHALQSINRPVDGRTEQRVGVKMRLEADAKRKKQEEGIRRLVGQDGCDEDEDEYMREPQLAGLMSRGRRAGKDLTGIVKARSNTRAAAGFVQSPKKPRRRKDALGDISKSNATARRGDSNELLDREEYSEYESGDDDLDAIYSGPVNLGNPKATTTQRPLKSEDHRRRGIGEEQGPGTSKGLTHNRHLEHKRENTVKNGEIYPFGDVTGGNDVHTTIGDEWNYKRSRSEMTSEYLAKRKATKGKQEREEKRDAQRGDDIPTFLV